MSASRAIARMLLAAGMLTTAYAQVPEPETVIYGRIVNRTGGQEYQLAEGTVSVTIPNGSAAPLVVAGPIGSLQDGKYSYLLKIPHYAKSLGLAAKAGALPLNPSESELDAENILVNGQPARLLDSSSVFAVSQPNRAGVHRVDLEVFDAILDTDGDGIPDWWEDKYGLDKQLASDAKLRSGNNRYTNLEAYRLGIDPRLDDTLPQLLTSELTVMSEGSTGLLLRAVASSSAPDQIVYRLTETPAGGSLILRNSRPDPKLADRVLSQGGTFTQADVNAGRVEFQHSNPETRSITLKLELVASAHPQDSVAGQVTLNVYQPSPVEGRAGVLWASSDAASSMPDAVSAADLWKRRATPAFAADWEDGQKDGVAAFLLARWCGYSIWDGRSELPSHNLAVPSAGMSAREYSADYLPKYGRARSHVLLAGKGAVRLEGGMSGDFLVAGEGNATLRGNAGPDFFVAGTAQTTIEDFSPSQRDVLDLSALLNGAPGPLKDRMNVTVGAGTTFLQIPLGGNKTARVVLRNLSVTADMLEKWRRAGTLFTGEITPDASPENHAPIAAADQGFVVAGQEVTIPVLANDEDPDGDGLSIDSITQGLQGTAEIVGNSILYTPSPSFNGRDEFTYTVSDGQGGLATGNVTISYPYPASAGTYVQVVLGPDGAPIGQMTVTLLPSGGFTVKVSENGVTYAGRGQFDPDGHAQVDLRAGKQTVSLTLSMDLADPTFPMTGSLQSGGETSQVPQTVAVNNASKRPPASFTMALRMPAGEAPATGFVTVNVTRGSAARIVGQVSDGTPFASAALLRRDGSVSWTTPLYRGKGWLLGRWSLAATGSIGGTTQWVRLADTTQSGFDRSLGTEGSPYVAPSVASVSALTLNDERNATVALSGADLSTALEVPVTFLNNDVIQPAAESALRLKLTRSSGLLAGTISSGNVTRTIRGVILQKQNQGVGFFLSGAQSGAMELLPK